MGILQGGGDLLHVADDCGKCKACSTGVTLPKGSAWGIVHDQHGRSLLHSKVEHTHNMAVLEANQSLCLFKEPLRFFVTKGEAQHFERSRTVEIAMLAQ